MAGFDVQGARNAGYSDAEIAQHLASAPGVKFDVEGALKAGYSPTEIISHVTGEPTPKSEGYIDTFRHGIAGTAGNIGETLKDLGATNVGAKFKAAAEALEPQNGVAPAPVVDQEGVHVGNLPRAVVGALPGMALPLAAAKVMPGGAIPKLLAGSAAYALQALGPRAKERAVNNTGDENAEPTRKDMLAAGASIVPEMGVGAI